MFYDYCNGPSVNNKTPQVVQDKNNASLCLGPILELNAGWLVITLVSAARSDTSRRSRISYGLFNR